jgi:hypothetical protein
MKSRFLFPYWCKFLGYALLLADIPLFIINEDTFFKTILSFTIAGLLLAGFSRERIEDEQISKLRLESLQWAIYLYYLILIVSLILYKGNDIGQVLRFNLKFPLIFFIIRFRWVIFRLNRSSGVAAKLA